MCPGQAWKAIKAIREEKSESSQSQRMGRAARPPSSPGCFSFLLGGSAKARASVDMERELEALRAELKAKRSREDLLFVDEAARKDRSCEDQVAAANRRLCCPISGLLLKNPVTAVDGTWHLFSARLCGALPCVCVILT